MISSCILRPNLMQLRPLAETVARPTDIRTVLLKNKDSRTSTTQKGMFVMKNTFVIKAAAAAVVVALAGCTDLKPLQSQVDDLKSQVAKLQSDVAGAKSSADAASAKADAASTAASGAQSTANQALAAAQAAQAAVDATNEKIDRMFKRSISK